MNLSQYKHNGNYSFKIRSQIIVPPDHVLMQFDLGKAESWVVAYLADEPWMKAALHNGDIHRLTAAVIFEHELAEGITLTTLSDKSFWEALKRDINPVMRYVGKQQNHAKAYREGPFKAAEVINKQSDKPPYVTVTVKESKRYDAIWHEFYNVKDWWARIDQIADSTRTLVTTYGRVRMFFAQWGDQLKKEMTAYEPQSTVSDHFKGVIHDELKIEGGIKLVHERVVKEGRGKIVNESHDSIAVEAPKKGHEELAKEIHGYLERPLMINKETFTIPCDCEIGDRWGELTEVDIS